MENVSIKPSLLIYLQLICFNIIKSFTLMFTLPVCVWGGQISNNVDIFLKNM